MRGEAPQLGGRRQLRKAVWTVSLPILFAGISETIIQVTDTVFLARVGTVELGAFALADTLLDVWTVPVVGLVDAMVILIGRRVGQGQRRAVRSTFLTGMLLLGAVSAALAVTIGVGSPIAGDVVAESSAISAAVDRYVRIAALGVVVMSLNLGYSALYIGLARTRVFVTAAVIVSLTNLVGSYALILGGFGLPALGIEGAAWSFVAAEVAGFVYLTAHTRRHGVLRVPADAAPGEPGGRAVRTLVRLSGPMALSALVEAARWLLFFMLMEQVSEQAVAAANVVYACFVTMLIATDALGDTTYSLVSNLIGRDEERRLGTLLRSAIAANLAVSLPLVAVALIWPGAVLWVFALGGNGVVDPSMDLRIAAVGVLVMIPAEMWIAAVAGTGDTDAALGLEVVMSAGFVVWAYAALLVWGLPTAAAWLAAPVTALVSLPLAYWWVRSGRWKRRGL